MRAVALFAALIGSGCTIVAQSECKSLDELCPDLDCDDYKQDRDGCSICECTAPAQITVCWDDADCSDGQQCDSVNYCEAAPACTAEPCPHACYGRCVDPAQVCDTDADCADGEVCSPVTNARDVGGGEQDKAPPEGGGDVPAPPPCASDSDCSPGSACVDGICQSTGGTGGTGVCVPLDCSTDRPAIDLPACPPGTEPNFDFSGDPCGVAVCEPIDRCRDLDPDTCRQTPGCEVFVDDGCGACGDADPACDCAVFERCASTDDCAGLDADACLANPACELVDGVATGDGGASDAPACEVCDETGACKPCDGTEPPTSTVCVPKTPEDGCASDAECLPGQRCALVVVCATGCTTDAATGEEVCVDECWNEPGACVDGGGTCWDITDPTTCTSTPGCELVPGADGGSDGGAPPPPCDPADPDCSSSDPIAPPAAPICQPVSTSCFDDSQCLAGQHCEQVETCPPCDPSTNDIDCLSPCFVEGVCVDGAPPPSPCSVDSDCGPGGSCVTVETCESCTDADGAERPAPCEPVCTTTQVCANEAVACFSDGECGEGEFCDFSQQQCGGGRGFIAIQCNGFCAPLDVTGPGDGTYCLTADDCPDPATQGCTTNDAVCRDNPNSDVEACWGWCTSGCGDALTPAQDPSTLQCVVFPDTCFPPEWSAVDTCG